MIEIKKARKGQAAEIARLIMMAMSDDCCLYFCGVGHGLDDFRRMMTSLVAREDSRFTGGAHSISSPRYCFTTVEGH